jgi:hypothetical protein
MKIGQSYSTVRCLIARAWLDFGKTPDLIKLENVLQRPGRPLSKSAFDLTAT